MKDLTEIDLEWKIGLAQKGDGELLAELIRSDEPIKPILREFLADVVAGKIKLAVPVLRTRSYIAKSGRWLREKAVVRAVRVKMRDAGKERDKFLRTKLTRIWCGVYGTTPNDVEDYQRHSRRITPIPKPTAKPRKLRKK
ncbi:MAG: hypothetical protein HXX15_21200 [Rhodopseudomonas sp.]|uniref:hypothetical protein n=1 Tax=Rhodopseudomonas sp. TaxID=1078 RepID=UPI0017DD564E|nr:hypothetical protein [Rhodopseudomonas sp.]NVN88604.1 hypothetical protein [Rhodopseudomonas sp.]